MGSVIRKEKRYINQIPAIVWGESSKDAYVYIHGKMSCKEKAEEFAKIAERKGYQTISFDLPEHGERSGQNEPCDIWTGKKDLLEIDEYASSRWQRLSIYACSIGAHFALHSYPEKEFQKCLFQSPILSMDYLIDQIFQWYHLSKEDLREKKTIETPIHKLTWDYYVYVKEHPIMEWKIPTCILYAKRDPLQSQNCMEEFARQFHCGLRVEENCEHGFANGNEVEIEKQWLEDQIK
ncbi:alpha/beta superfamily hydrolase [Lachnospiraceae bacterium KM106-2]|nr:alpha/beta superfamily hydrolase [Lachnospiraceae bacterium KM106-2]